MPEICLIYTTFPDQTAAQKVARTLISEKLAACANIMLPYTAIYQWAGTVQEDQEVVMILKTRKDLYDQVQARIVELHDYDCPCVLSIPVDNGYKPFMSWIGEETRMG